jgi:hypothetical protein
VVHDTSGLFPHIWALTENGLEVGGDEWRAVDC